jgi:2-octaprenyl-6-methoxyphenol hydroxylase
MSSAAQCDIVIVGGGLVGASLACALAPLGYAITVVEAVAPGAASQPSYDDRTLALGAASCAILEGLGLWPQLQEHATAIRQVVVSEPGQPWRVELDAAESGRSAFGHVIEARRFGQVVRQRVSELDAVRVLCPARVTGLQNGPAGVSVELETEAGPQTIETRLLVAADGTHSAVRGLLGIAAREKHYQQTAVICNVTPREAHRGRAYEQLTSSGPFAVLPHVGGRCGLVWCAPEEQARALLELPEDEFLARASARADQSLGGFVKLGKRSSYALKLVLPERDSDQRVVLVGNAAHAIHPAGAQGFNLGLRDVACLAEVLADANREAPGAGLADPGEAACLERYSHWCRPDREAVVGWTDGLVGLFASPLSLARGLRGAALLAHVLLPPLRRRMASQAMGFRGHMPRLALGEPLLAGRAANDV